MFPSPRLLPQAGKHGQQRLFARIAEAASCAAIGAEAGL